jgi:predicted component of type VI protein secretion system
MSLLFFSLLHPSIQPTYKTSYYTYLKEPESALSNNLIKLLALVMRPGES